MIIDVKEEPDIIRVGDFEETNFSIVTNDKMFDILSNRLYNNKILAPMRELSTNAHDSHVEAGKSDKPIDVHLPDYYNKVFYVQDYGIGMSKQEIQDLYSVYGMSSRENSNDFTGCLGLGSKSPFAYVKSFLITSVKDGEKFVYHAMMEAGRPKLLKMHEEKTEEENGVKIEFDVKHQDVKEFQDNGKDFYEYFHPTPNFVGYEPDFSSKEFFYEDELGKVFYKGKDNYTNFYAVMGNVTYPIDRSIFTNINLPLIKSWLNAGYTANAKDIILHCPIGSIDMTVSRESLEMTDKNREFLSKAASKLWTKIHKKVLKEIEAEDDYLEKLRKIARYDRLNYIDYKTPDLLKYLAPLLYKKKGNFSFLTTIDNRNWNNNRIKKYTESERMMIDLIIKDDAKWCYSEKRMQSRQQHREFFRDNDIDYHGYLCCVIHEKSLLDMIENLGIEVVKSKDSTAGKLYYLMRSNGEYSNDSKWTKCYADEMPLYNRSRYYVIGNSTDYYLEDCNLRRFVASTDIPVFRTCKKNRDLFEKAPMFVNLQEYVKNVVLPDVQENILRYDAIAYAKQEGIYDQKEVMFWSAFAKFYSMNKINCIDTIKDVRKHVELYNSKEIIETHLNDKEKMSYFFYKEKCISILSKEFDSIKKETMAKFPLLEAVANSMSKYCPFNEEEVAWYMKQKILEMEKK